MKNIKVSTKLLLSFGVVAALTIIVGIVSIISLSTMDKTYSGAIDNHGRPLATMALALSDIQSTAMHMRDAILYADNPQVLRLIEADTLEKLALFEDEIGEYSKTVSRDDMKETLTYSMGVYEEVYKPAILCIITEAKAGKLSLAEMEEHLDASMEATDKMLEGFVSIMETNKKELDQVNAGNTEMAGKIIMVFLFMGIIAAGVSVSLGLYISNLIGKPLKPLTNFMVRASATGDLSLDEQDMETISKAIHMKDEIGQLINAAAGFVGRITEIGQQLETAAHGDLTSETELLSEKDTLGISLKFLIDNLNNMFGEIHASTSQVSMGSRQVADGAQTLAQGATEQAAAIDELSGSIAEASEKTKENEHMANEAAKLAGTIMKCAEKGSKQMDEMIQAVRDINEASQSIGKIIKTIDDIAFQTNILALNAAVEAARAGQHGKGFAVVADEVRNLAAKSAEAAKDTAALIENSMEKAEYGSHIAEETAVSLAEIVSGISESNRIVETIAESSIIQSSDISQITKGIDQVAVVIQQNSATAEESAAASQEMSGQSSILEEMIGQFKLKGTEAVRDNKQSAVENLVEERISKRVAKHIEKPVALRKQIMHELGEFTPSTSFDVSEKY